VSSKKTKKKSTKNGSSVAYGFHITRDNGQMRKGEIPVLGATYRATGPIRICNNGMHASHSVKDAATFRFLAAGRIVSLVKLSGEIEEGSKKMVARNRKVLAMIKLNSAIPTVDETFFTGFDKQELEVVDPKWYAKVEEDLHKQYAKNKAKIDAVKTLIVTPENDEE
jgi:hypothetical protein